MYHLNSDAPLFVRVNILFSRHCQIVLNKTIVNKALTLRINTSRKSSKYYFI